MDFIRPINPPSKQKQYIIVCTDYLTKWGENKAIKEATKEKVVEFLTENVFYKFGYPRELVIDQGSQFTSNMIEEMLRHHKIKHRTSTPYHPQANEQVDVTNRALEGILTKVVSSSRKDWAERLVVATWAYNTTLQIRTIDDESIPLLVNGHRFIMYKRPLSKQEFIDDINKTMMMVEKVPAPPSTGHGKRQQNNKDSGENIHKVPESYLWVENLVRRPNDEKTGKKNKKIPG
eukprot:PITA_06692